jgi:hypothetical protein
MILYDCWFGRRDLCEQGEPGGGAGSLELGVGSGNAPLIVVGGQRSDVRIRLSFLGEEWARLRKRRSG